MRWEHFEHGADVGVRGFGATVSEAFAGAAAALCALVSGEGRPVRSVVEEEILCDAPDPESLLVRFLNELISRMSAHRMVYGEFSVGVNGSGGGGASERSAGWTVAARVRGEPIDPDRHEPTVEPKGATFMEARVIRDDTPRRAEGDAGRGAQQPAEGDAGRGAQEPAEAGARRGPQNARREPQWTAQCVVDV